MTITRQRTGLGVGDLLWRNMLSAHPELQSASKSNIGYPIDIWEDLEGLHFEIAVINSSKNDIEITVENNTLKISNKDRKDSEEILKRKYIHQGISRKKFDFAWEISTMYMLEDLKAKMSEGILRIDIPFTAEAIPKKIKIN